MVKKIVVWSAVVLAGLALLVPVVMRNEPAKILRAWRQVIDLCDGVPPAGMIAQASRATEILTYFTADAQVEVGNPYPLTLDRGQLPALLQRAWTMLDEIDVISRGQEVELGPGRTNAVMETAVELALTAEGRTESALETYRIAWQKHEGRWRIARVSRISPVEKPGL